MTTEMVSGVESGSASESHSHKAAEPAPSREAKFLAEVRKRAKADTGVKAAFKRALSGERHHLRKVYPFVLPYLEGIHGQQQEIWIFVACLAVYHDQDAAGKGARAEYSFARSCWDLHSAGKSKGPERRFKALLETDLANIQSPIAALVRLIKNHDERKIWVDYPKLIQDLCRWDHPDQRVQDRWAMDFWRGSGSGEKSEA